MRNVCQVDVLIGPRDKLSPAADVAKRLFDALKGCRILTASVLGPRISVSLLLPEIPGGYPSLAYLTSLIEEGLTGKGAVLASVHSLREATPLEVLERVLLTRKNGR